MSQPNPLHPLSAPRLRGLLIVLCAALALVVAGNSALAIALPDVAADLGADQSDLTWIIDVYALTFAALLLSAGLAADRVGRRTILVLGLVVFAGANIASAFSPDPTWFIALRAAAGAGAAAVFPVTLSALVDAYPEERRAFAIGVWSGVSSAGAVLGTIVAGALLEAFWWGSVQLVFGVVAALLVLPVVTLVAQNRNPALSLDPLGAIWSIVALGGIVFGVVEGPQRGWVDPITLLAFGIGLVGLIAFIIHQLRSAVPSLDVRLFRNRGLAAGGVIVTIQFFASLGFFVLSPQYLQIVLQYTPLGAALALLIVPVGVGVGIGGSAALSSRFGARVPGSLGLLLMAAGFAIAAVGLPRGVDASVWVLGTGALVFGVGFGMGITPGTQLIIDGLPAERRSVASAVNDITREVGGVLGIAVLSSILSGFYRADIRPALEGLPEQLRGVVDAGAGAALGVADSFGPQGESLALAAREAFATGLSASLSVGAVVLALASLITFLVAPPSNTEPRTHIRRDSHIMTTYTAQRTVPQSIDDAFSFIANPVNLPHYFPRITAAILVDHDLVRTTAVVDEDGSDDDRGDPVTADARFRADEAARTISWGSPDDDHYSGNFSVEEVADGSTLHLTIRTSADYPGIQESLEEALSLIAAKLREV